MNRAVAPAAAVALLLLLSGCSGGDEVNVAVASPEAASPAVTASEAPLTAVSPSASPEAATPEAAFLSEIRDKLPADTTIPDATDAQLLDAGKRACEQMASGTDFAEVSVIDGEQPNGLGIREDSSLIAAVASGSICP